MADTDKRITFNPLERERRMHAIAEEAEREEYKQVYLQGITQITQDLMQLNHLLEQEKQMMQANQ